MTRRLIQEGDRGPVVAGAALRVAADAVVTEARRLIDEQSASQSGRLRNSFVISQPKIIGPVAEVVVTNNAPHALSTEFKRRPGTWPPFKPLERWVVRSGLFDFSPAEGITSAAFALQRKIGEARGGKGPPISKLREFVARRYSSATLQRYALASLVRSIQRKIRFKGIDARPFFGPALRAEEPARRFREAVERAFARGG